MCYFFLVGPAVVPVLGPAVVPAVGLAVLQYLCVVHQVLVLDVVSSPHHEHDGLSHIRSTRQ